MHRGSCLCGAVTFEVAAELGAPDACHCTQCRKQSGHFWVSTSVKHAALKLTGADRLTWYQSSEKTRRGFCATCGSFLFWERNGGDNLGIGMGAFDTPTGTHLDHHIFTANKGDYYDVPRLPPPAELERICKGLAVLDAILSPEWDSRYYSFDASWAPGERMASMRNGEGDDYFMVFTDDVAFVKGFEHERPRLDPDAVFHGLPLALAKQRTEPAFSMDRVTYGGFYADGAWTIRGDDFGRFAIPSGQIDRYVAFAAEYYGRELPLVPVWKITTGAPLDDELVAKIDPDRKLADLAEDVAAIGY